MWLLSPGQSVAGSRALPGGQMVRRTIVPQVGCRSARALHGRAISHTHKAGAATVEPGRWNPGPVSHTVLRRDLQDESLTGGSVPGPLADKTQGERARLISSEPKDLQGGPANSIICRRFKRGPQDRQSCRLLRDLPLIARCGLHRKVQFKLFGHAHLDGFSWVVRLHRQKPRIHFHPPRGKSQ